MERLRRKAREGLARALSWVKQPILGCFGFSKAKAMGHNAQVASGCHSDLSIDKQSQYTDEPASSSVDEAPTRQSETDQISLPSLSHFVCPKTKIPCGEQVVLSGGSTPAKKNVVVWQDNTSYEGNVALL